VIPRYLLTRTVRALRKAIEGADTYDEQVRLTKRMEDAHNARRGKV